MTKQEIQEFIERMQEAGDDWTEEQVTREYGDTSLEEATGLHELEMMADILVTATLAANK